MKYFTIGILILCLLTGLCWYAEREISERTRQIANPLELALSAVREGNDPDAHAWVSQAAVSWAKNEGVLASLISHDHTNGIGEAMARLPWLNGKDLGQAVEEVLKQIRGLADMERIVWRNIL